VLIERDGVSARVIGCAIAVHRALGPGLLESAYETCLLAEFESDGLSVRSQVPVAIQYREVDIDCAYRADFIVNESVIVEIKSIARLEQIHQAQLLTYLRLLKLREGLLINFNVPVLTRGLRRVLL